MHRSTVETYSVNSFELDTNRSINNYTYNARVLYNARDYY